MFKQVIRFLLIACVLVGVYKLFGGDIGSFIDTAGTVLLNIVDKGSDIIAQILDAIF